MLKFLVLCFINYIYWTERLAAILQGLETVYKLCDAENQRKSKGEDAFTETERKDLLKEALVVSRDNVLRASEICKYSDEIAVTLQSFVESNTLV